MGIIHPISFFGSVQTPSNTKSLALVASSFQYAYITNVNQTGLEPTSAITIECWVNFTSLPGDSSGYSFVNKEPSTGGLGELGYNFLITKTGTSLIRLEYHYCMLNINVEEEVDWGGTGYGGPRTGEWYHFAVTNEVNGANRDVKFYINGLQHGATQTYANNLDLNPNNANFNIGYRPNYLDAKIDDVRVWSVARSAAEILADYIEVLVGDETNLEGLWLCEDDVTDETSNENDLTTGGSPSYSTDRWVDESPYSLDLEKDDWEFVYIPYADQVNLTPTGDLSLETWVKFESVPGTGGAAYLVSTHGTFSSEGYSFALKDTSDVLYLRFFWSKDASNTWNHDVAWTPSTGTWYHVAAVHYIDGSNRKTEFYVNGTQQGTTQSTADINNISYDSSPFRIGATGGSTTAADAKLAHVRMWNDRRTSSEIADKYDVELAGTEAGFQGYWFYNNYNLKDKTGNVNDLTNYGGVFSSDAPL